MKIPLKPAPWSDFSSIDIGVWSNLVSLHCNKRHQYLSGHPLRWILIKSAATAHRVVLNVYDCGWDDKVGQFGRAVAIFRGNEVIIAIDSGSCNNVIRERTPKAS